MWQMIFGAVPLLLMMELAPGRATAGRPITC
jgi:hypothetical protein